MKQGIETREHWMERPPFSASQAEKDAFFQAEMKRLTEYHRRSCEAYDDICNGLDQTAPYLPVSLFKDLELRSVPEEEVIRQVTSSGTTGQQVSRIFLDAETADLQRRALAAITGDFIGGRRMPMLIIDSPEVLRDRRRFSARGSGILGFSMMSSRRFYALDAQMQLDPASIEAFLEAAGDGPSFAFGFTFMIWQYLYEALAATGKTIDLKGCYLIHGGGWKKLQDRSVSDEEFRRCLRKTCGFGEISDYYGMAEQTGSIFMQCAEGHLHASNYSDIEILDPVDFSPCKVGDWGLIALRSWLPGSYPGHMLLTEDRGRILGEDDCPCGRKGRYFEISGRIKKAEIRGCSDTFEAASAPAPGADLQILAGTWPMPAGIGTNISGITAGQKILTTEDPIPDTMALQCFDPLVMGFLAELSQKFMKESAYRQFPDIYALGFWLRPGHLQQILDRQGGIDSRKGRGLVLHIAPSNMPTMFAYSWITALLAGNPSVIRLSGRENPISETILQGIREVLEQPAYESLQQRNAFVRFPRGHQALEEISARCAARMIWGGDATVAGITAVPKVAGAVDIAFPDKYSIALLSADAVAAMSDDDLRMQAHLFCRDTYGADQNACSSPRSVFWVNDFLRNDPERGRKNDLGSAADAASNCRQTLSGVKQRWWDAVAKEAERYKLEAWMATEKYRLLCRNYAEDRRLGPVQTWTNRLYVIPCGSAAEWVSDASAEHAAGRENCAAAENAKAEAILPEAKLGMFYEFDLQEITELYPLLQEKIQTVVCIGADPEGFLQGVRNAGCPGVDRTVCAGEALEFDTIWDRKDLIRLLSV